MNMAIPQALIHLKQVLMTPLTQLHIIPLYVIIQSAVFLSVWFIMNTFFFKPFSTVYEKRNSKTIRALEDAKTLNHESENLEADLRKKIEQSTASANKLRLSYIEDAKNKRDEMIKKAGKEMQEYIKSMVSQIEKEKTDLLGRLSADIKQFIPLISGKMMLK